MKYPELDNAIENTFSPELRDYLRRCINDNPENSVVVGKEDLHIQDWKRYVDLGKKTANEAALKSVFIQLNFPISEETKDSEAYRAATRRGVFPEGADGVSFADPDGIDIFIHDSIAGKIPVIITADRSDFETLIQAIVKKNQPVEIPRSMGACMIAGYNNWERVNQMKAQWDAENQAKGLFRPWAQRFKEIQGQKDLYKDRFIFLSNSPYSGVPGKQLGIDEAEWRRLSVIIRLEHECTHYFTKKHYGTMENHLVDELLADCMGIIAASGGFNASWFCHFMGLENYPEYREGGRFQNYLGDPQLVMEDQLRLREIVVKAANNLESFISSNWTGEPSLEDRQRLLTHLSKLRLSDFATTGAIETMEKALFQSA